MCFEQMLSLSENVDNGEIIRCVLGVVWLGVLA